MNDEEKEMSPYTDTGVYTTSNEQLGFVVNGKKTNIENFIETHQLPEDTTIGELLEFCRKQQWK